MIKPIANAITAPGPPLRLVERHPELPQIPQLIDQLAARRLAARKRPRDLSMRQAQIEWAMQQMWLHICCVQGVPQPHAVPRSFRVVAVPVEVAPGRDRAWPEAPAFWLATISSSLSELMPNI